MLTLLSHYRSKLEIMCQEILFLVIKYAYFPALLVVVVYASVVMCFCP